jgi:NAD+ kinase
MANVLIVAHHERVEAGILAQTAATWLRRHGHVPWMAPDDARALDLGELAAERPPSDAELALSLGGDGTMLRTVQVLDGASVPVIGVNVGYLGYLTEVEPNGLEAALERWFAPPSDPARAAVRIEERMMLDVALRRSGDSGTEGPWRALNEAVLEKRESGHTVRLLVRIDGAPFTSYAADGFIVATPTGSTAYSLSARGPVVSPAHRALLLTPVSPHMLFDRSLVLDPDEPVEVEVLGHRPVDLAVDGQRVGTLAEGDVVSCQPAQAVARFVRFGPHRFHQILKAKFGLSDR